MKGVEQSVVNLASKLRLFFPRNTESTKFQIVDGHWARLVLVNFPIIARPGKLYST